jgi:hypothetical protein
MGVRVGVICGGSTGEAVIPGVIVGLAGKVFVETGTVSCVNVGFMVCGDWVLEICEVSVPVDSGVEREAMTDWIVFGVVVLAGV